MRIYPGTTVDYEFATLGGLGYTGTLNDRQFAALRAEGLTGSLADMFKQFDGTLGGGGPTLSEQVEAILAGTTGFALDPSDTTTMWKDTGETAPVTTIADPVRRIKSKWGTTVYNFDAPTDAARPAWNGVAGLDYDGTDDFINLLSSDILRNKPAAFFSYKALFDVLGSAYSLHFSTDTTTNHRFSNSINATGLIAVGGRILDATGTTFASSAAGAIVAGAACVLSSQINYAGDKAMQMWKDGSSILTGTIAGTAGNTSNTASAQGNFAAYSAGGSYFNGKMGRVVMLPSIPTAENRAIIEAWINEVAL